MIEKVSQAIPLCVGDLVKADPTHPYGKILVFSDWHSKRRPLAFDTKELAIVLDTQGEFGDNVCKIVTSSGVSGWVNLVLLKKL
jgi:hypothetical protein